MLFREELKMKEVWYFHEKKQRIFICQISLSMVLIELIFQLKFQIMCVCLAF